LSVKFPENKQGQEKLNRVSVSPDGSAQSGGADLLSNLDELAEILGSLNDLTPEQKKEKDELMSAVSSRKSSLNLNPENRESQDDAHRLIARGINFFNPVSSSSALEGSQSPQIDQKNQGQSSLPFKKRWSVFIKAAKDLFSSAQAANNAQQNACGALSGSEKNCPSRDFFKKTGKTLSRWGKKTGDALSAGLNGTTKGIGAVVVGGFSFAKGAVNRSGDFFKSLYNGASQGVSDYYKNKKERDRERKIKNAFADYEKAKEKFDSAYHNFFTLGRKDILSSSESGDSLNIRKKELAAKLEELEAFRKYANQIQDDVEGIKAKRKVSEMNKEYIKLESAHLKLEKERILNIEKHRKEVKKKNKKFNKKQIDLFNELLIAEEKLKQKQEKVQSRNSKVTYPEEKELQEKKDKVKALRKDPEDPVVVNRFLRLFKRKESIAPWCAPRDTSVFKKQDEGKSKKPIIP
jgi:hypothetical protein